MRRTKALLLTLSFMLAAGQAAAAQGVVCRTDGNSDPKDALLRAVEQLNATTTAGSTIAIPAGDSTRTIEVRAVSAPTITVVPDGQSNRAIACVTARGPLLEEP